MSHRTYQRPIPTDEQSYCDVRDHQRCDGRTVDDFEDCLCTCHPSPEEREL